MNPAMGNQIHTRVFFSNVLEDVLVIGIHHNIITVKSDIWFEHSCAGYGQTISYLSIWHLFNSCVHQQGHKRLLWETKASVNIINTLNTMGLAQFSIYRIRKFDSVYLCDSSWLVFTVGFPDGYTNLDIIHQNKLRYNLSYWYPIRIEK